MTLWEIFRFEVGYQSRRAWTWAYFAALLAICFRITTEAYTGNARDGGYAFNSPFVIASITVLASTMALLVAAALAGDAAARDVQTRMHPLVYTAPVGRGAYLGGRFLAAFALNAVILLSVPAALLLSTVAPGSAAELLGPFQPRAYLGAYLLIAVPNAFVATALLFAMAALSRRAIASYLGAVLLFFLALFVGLFVAVKLGRWELAKMLDPIGLTILSEISRATTAAEKNTLAAVLNASLLWNRAAWLAVAVGVLALTHLRFRFEHPVATGGWGRRRVAAADATDESVVRGGPIVVPHVRRTFGRAVRARQTLAIAAHAFRQVALSWGGLVLVALTTVLVVMGPMAMNHMGVPELPTTQQMTSFVGNSGEILWTIVPLLTAFYVGELVWRERETGLSEIADAAPVPEWARFLGRFAGIGLVFVAYQLLMLVACVLVQAQLGYLDFELGLYVRVLFGLQLVAHLLFALLAFAVHVLVNQKYAGHLVVLTAYAFTTFGPSLGVEHVLLVYGSDPGWAYSDMRGFAASVAPWAWLKLYWAAWALLLAVVATVLWVRGTEHGPAARLQLARRRLTRRTVGVAAVAAALVVALGGFVFYNTNVLNAYDTASAAAERRAAYERRYGRYAGVPQPQLTATTLRVELFPRRREAEVRGTYRLVNTSGVAIDSLHLATQAGVETGPADLDRPATLVRDDRTLRHRVYALQAPLLPGDSMRLRFTVRFHPRGFTNGGVDPSVAANGTFFEGEAWLPAIGYQAGRELDGAGDRRAHGLPPRRAVRALDDVAARHDVAGARRIAFDAVVGTDEGQLAVAPGTLRRTWTENGRRYFHYATDAPIRNDFAVYSAAYAVRDARWVDSTAGAGAGVAIQIVHHPGHATNVDRMVRSVQASLGYFTRHFGPYPYPQLRLVERPGPGVGLHGAPINVSYFEGFALLHPADDPRDIDFPFAVVAHEIAHQWWGNQLSPANVEGAALLGESLAWYSALSVVEATYGPEHLQRLLGMLREAYLAPRARGAVPLLRASDWLLAYRKGPFAMYTLREYVGEARVNTALRRLLAAHGTGTPPLPVSLDLYRELQAVTPDSLRPLLADLFEANTYWKLETTRATAEPADAGGWRVTLDVTAGKEVVDTAGTAAEVPMSDLVEVGVYAAERDGRPGEPLYLRMHRLRAGEQRVTVTVPREPAAAGIDPRHLLIDVDTEDNVAAVTRDARPRPGGGDARPR